MKTRGSLFAETRIDASPGERARTCCHKSAPFARLDAFHITAFPVYNVTCIRAARPHCLRVRSSFVRGKKEQTVNEGEIIIKTIIANNFIMQKAICCSCCLFSIVFTLRVRVSLFSERSRGCGQLYWSASTFLWTKSLKNYLCVHSLQSLIFVLSHYDNLLNLFSRTGLKIYYRCHQLCILGLS
jgi:hypothetical protein